MDDKIRDSFAKVKQDIQLLQQEIWQMKEDLADIKTILGKIGFISIGNEGVPTDKQTNRQTDKQTNRQTDKQTNRQTDNRHISNTKNPSKNHKK